MRLFISNRESVHLGWNNKFVYRPKALNRKGVDKNAQRCEPSERWQWDKAEPRAAAWWHWPIHPGCSAFLKFKFSSRESILVSYQECNISDSRYTCLGLLHPSLIARLCHIWWTNELSIFWFNGLIKQFLLQIVVVLARLDEQVGLDVGLHLLHWGDKVIIPTIHLNNYQMMDLNVSGRSGC